MAEKEPPPKSKEPKAEKGASAKSGKDAAIEEAKKTIKDITSKDEAVRLEAIQKLRNPPLESLDRAKEDLKTAPIQEINWLVKSADEILHSPEAALFAARVAEGGALKDDPRWLLAKTVELAYSVRSDATPEARREVNAMIVKVGGHLKELMRDQAFEGVRATSFDEAMYGSPMEGIVPMPDASMFKEDKPEEETITDPELIRMLREINKNIRTNPEYLTDPKYLERDIALLQQKASERGVPEGQIREALTRLVEKKNEISKALEADRAKKAAERDALRYKGRIVEYTDVMDTIPEADRLSPEEAAKKLPHPLQGHISQEKIDLLLQGPEGQKQYFYEMITEIYTMGKSMEHAELPEMYEYKEFQEYMRWLHPKNTDYYLQPYDVIWHDIQRHFNQAKQLLFTPGEITDKLKNLRYMTGADLDFYAKNFFGSNYAISLYEETVKDILSDRRMKYEEAVRLLNKKGENNILDQYRKLSAERKKGRLSIEDEQRFQELQETIDLAGYGVNLWDSDVQNYTELDLEINTMSHEVDRLELKQKKLKGKGEDLTALEKEQLERLKDNIKYKREKTKVIEGDGMDVRTSLHKDKGLSEVDKEVKRRLLLVLQDRYPDREIKDWELNMAVWSARQWMLGSSRLISISSSMAIKPGIEYKNMVEEINPGKYHMKSPFLEDIQRAINPDLFFDRFYVGDRMGDIFRAQLDKSLLEAKGFVYKKDKKYEDPYEEKLNPIVRQTKEFMRQVSDESSIPYQELLVQGFLETGGNFDGSGWRAEMGAVDEIRKKYLDMKKRGLLDKEARLDNQGLGIQYAMKSKPEDKEGRKEILDRMMQRTPSVILQILGNEAIDNIYTNHGLGDKGARDRFRRALSVAQISTWDVEGQSGDKRNRAFKDINFLNKGDFDELLRPFLEKEGFGEGEISGFSGMLGEINGVLQDKKDGIVKAGFPITLTLSDMDWKDNEMFQIGTAGLDRRARDMALMYQLKELELLLESDPEILCAKDPKETLKKLKEMRTVMNGYTTGAATERAIYEWTKTWLNFNKHRHWGIQGIPLAEQAIKAFAELDTRNSLPKRFVDLNIEIKGKKHYLFQEELRKKFEKSVFQHWLEERPHKAAEYISYAVRYTGPRGNAFEAKDLDKILDDMLLMGIFNSDEKLYHDLRREMKCSLGWQIGGLIVKYWWIAPLAAAFIGAKEGLEEEKKRSGGQ